jgi:hypothetical protein
MDAGMLVYRKRQSFLEKTEREWRIEEDALVFRAADGRETRKPWRDVASVRLRRTPSRFQMWGHTFDVAFKDGARWSIDNNHFAGFADFQDRTATYAPFVRAALARIRAAAPAAKAYAGTTYVSYVAQVALVAFAFAALAAVFLTIPVFEVSDPWLVTLKLLIIAALLPPFALWVRANYPRVISLDAIPPEVLPPEG